MFDDNCNSRTNGEYLFFNRIKDNIDLIVDVGCGTDSDYLEFKGEVHYFDPEGTFIETLSRKKNSNSLAIFNRFGLGTERCDAYYYPCYQSFIDRVTSCAVSDDANKVTRRIRTGEDYVTEKSIGYIDFLKIDTEGFELNVLKGFGEFLRNVGIVQFEYGGTYLDSTTTLNEVVDYLKEMGFHKFSYLMNRGTYPLPGVEDHYRYCNIVCVNKNNAYDPL